MCSLNATLFQVLFSLSFQISLRIGSDEWKQLWMGEGNCRSTPGLNTIPSIFEPVENISSDVKPLADITPFLLLIIMLLTVVMT